MKIKHFRTIFLYCLLEETRETKSLCLTYERKRLHKIISQKLEISREIYRPCPGSAMRLASPVTMPERVSVTLRLRPRPGPQLSNGPDSIKFRSILNGGIYRQYTAITVQSIH